MAALKNKKTSRQKTTVAIEPTARHLWLASLGALVAVRRESKAAVQRLAAGVEAAAARIRQTARNAEADLRGQVQPKMIKLSSDVEARLAPIVDKLGLDRFGLKSKAKRVPRNGRKPAAKKPTLRRVTRKPAKRVVKKAAN